MIKFGYKLNNKNRSLFIKYFKSMRISIVKFFLPNINTFLYYTFIPIFFLDVPIYHSIFHKFIHANFSFEIVREAKRRRSNHKRKFQIQNENLWSRNELWRKEKEKKKNSSKQLNGSVTALSVKSKVQSRVSLRPNSSTNLSAGKPDRNLVAGQRAVWQLAINSLLSPASSINRARQ